MKRTGNRRKRKKVRQKPRRKRRRSVFKTFLWIVGGIVAAVIVSLIIFDAYEYMHSSDRFAVTEVNIGGTVLLTQTDIVGKMGLPASVNIFDIDERVVTERVTAMPRVHTAFVETRLPRYMGVTVHERSPIAVLGDGPPFEIDVDGVVLGPARQTGSVTPPPKLVGKRLPRRLVSGATLNDVTVQAALSMCETLTASPSLPLLGSVSIDTTDPANLVMRIGGVDAEIWWGTDNYELKLAKLMAVWNKTGGDPPHSEYIDLRQGRSIPAK